MVLSTRNTHLPNNLVSALGAFEAHLINEKFMGGWRRDRLDRGKSRLARNYPYILRDAPMQRPRAGSYLRYRFAFKFGAHREFALIDSAVLAACSGVVSRFASAACRARCRGAASGQKGRQSVLNCDEGTGARISWSEAAGPGGV